MVQTVEAARDLGLDRISFLAADVSSEAFNRPEGWTPQRQNEVTPGPADLVVLAEQIDELERRHGALFDTGFIVESPTKLRSKILQYFEALAGVTGLPSVECNAPSVSAVVDTDGTVRPCFFHKPLGRLEKGGDLSSVLNSPEAREWRGQLDVATNPVCRKCVCSLLLRQT